MARGFATLCAFTHQPGHFARLGFTISPDDNKILNISQSLVSLTECVSACGTSSAVFSLSLTERSTALGAVGVSAAGAGAGLQASFDHGDADGYGLWLDPAVTEDPIYTEHWTERRNGV